MVTALDSFVRAEDVPSTDGLLGLEFINNQFVAIGAQVSWSDDGVHWNTVEQNGSMDLNLIAYGDGMYLAANRWGHLWVSEDLSEWMFLGSFQAAIVDLVYHEKMKTWFLATAESGKYGNTDMIYSSDDGLQWQLLSIEGLSFRGTWVSKLIPTGEGLQIQHQLGGESIFSSDLTHWQDVVEIGDRYSSGWIIERAHFVEGNGFMVNASKSNYAAVTTDLQHWTQSARMDPNLDVHIFDMAFGQGRFVAVGNGNSRTPGNVYSSSDGITWDSHSLPGDEVRALVGVAFGNGRFVICSSNNRIYYSSEQVDFKPEFTSQPTSALVHAGDVHLLTATLIEPGTSGFQWYKDGEPIPGATDSRLKIQDFDASDEGSYVLQVTAGQYSISSEEALLTIDSPNPLNNWKRHPGPVAQDLLSVDSNGELLVAVGRQGAIKSSLDGKSWNELDAGVKSDLYSVRWLNQQWIIVGDAGVLLKSAEGHTWEKVDINGATTSLIGVTNGPGGFVVVSRSGDIYQSTDLSEWNSLPPLDNQGISAIAASPSEYVVVGDHGMIARTNDLAKWDYEWIWPDFRLTNVRYMNEKFHISSLKNGYFVQSETGQWIDGLSVQMQLSIPMKDFYDVVMFKEQPQFAGNGFAGRTTNSRMYSLTSGLDVFGITVHQNSLVAVGQSGAIFLQSENSPWELHGGFSHFFDVAGKPGLVCVVGEGGPIQLSQNDEAFQPVFGLENEVLNAIAYGNDRFVAVGNTGLIATSPDGFTWETEKWEGVQLFTEVIFGNEAFLILSAGGKLLVGNGTNPWTEVGIGLDAANPTMVKFMDGSFVVYVSSKQLFRSKDGINWEMIEPGPQLPSSPSDIMKVNDRFMLYSSDSTVAFTQDWIHWELVDDFKFRQRGTTFGGANGWFIEWLAWLGRFGYWNGSPEQAVPINYPSRHRSFRLEWIGDRLYSVGGYGDIFYADFGSKQTPSIQVDIVGASPFTINIQGTPGSTWQIERTTEISVNGAWDPIERITLQTESILWSPPIRPDTPQSFYKFNLIQ